MLVSLDEEWWDTVGLEREVSPGSDPCVVVSSDRVTFPLPVRLTVKGRSVEAEMLDESGRIRYAGVEYSSPSPAARVATGWKSANGWILWRYHDQRMGKWRPIGDLRRES